MRRYLLTFFLIMRVFAFPVASIGGPTPVGAVMGGNVACEPTNPGCQSFPTQASFLCNGTGALLDCPQYFAPDWAGSDSRFFGITNRTNPPRCVQSTDGGVIWSLCPTNPFSVAGGGAFLTVASNGALVVAGDQGADNCIIRRSTDYGATWATVFTDTTATATCGVSFSAPTPSVLRCASTNAYCVMIGRTTGTFDLIPYFSTDNGATWTKGAAFNIVTGNEQVTVAVEDNGTLGSLARFQVTYAVQTFARKTGNVFVATGIVPTPPGAGTNTRCTGSMIFNGDESIVCGPDSIMTTTYRLFHSVSGVPSLTASFTLSATAPTFAQNPDNMAIAFNATTAYLIGRNDANTAVLIHITRDGFGSAPLLASLIPATALIAGCCRGDVALRSGNIYFTSGATGDRAFLGRIQ